MDMRQSVNAKQAGAPVYTLYAAEWNAPGRHYWLGIQHLLVLSLCLLGKRQPAALAVELAGIGEAVHTC